MTSCCLIETSACTHVLSSFQVDRPFHHSPPTSEPYIAYDCLCAQCTQYAETGWSTFVDQGITGPWQHYPEPNKLFYPFGTGPLYHPQHHGLQDMCHDRVDVRAEGRSEPTAALRHQETGPHDTEIPSLVAPSEVFYHHSPVPTLSECSTSSTSSSLRSSFGSMGWDEGQILHSVPTSNRPYDWFDSSASYPDRFARK